MEITEPRRFPHLPPSIPDTGQALTVRGLAGIPGLEGMAADPQWGAAYCDPPIPITPTTAQQSRALTVWMAPALALAA